MEYKHFSVEEHEVIQTMWWERRSMREIAKALDKATQHKDFIPQTKTGTLTYIAPDNLYLNEHCKLIYQNNY